MENIKILKDGDRIILAVDHATEETEQLILQIMNQWTKTKIGKLPETTITKQSETQHTNPKELLQMTDNVDKQSQTIISDGKFKGCKVIDIIKKNPFHLLELMKNQNLMPAIKASVSELFNSSKDEILVTYWKKNYSVFFSTFVYLVPEKMKTILVSYECKSPKELCNKISEDELENILYTLILELRKLQ